jgi:hypothetical protein
LQQNTGGRGHHVKRLIRFNDFSFGGADNHIMNAADMLATIDRLDSRQLRNQLAKLEQQRSALIILLRAAVAKERKERQSVRKARVTA